MKFLKALYWWTGGAATVILLLRVIEFRFSYQDLLIFILYIIGGASILVSKIISIKQK